MPHSMQYSGQKYKWFTWAIVVALPFYVAYKIIKNEL
jgi:hypothetical protein